MFSTTDILQGRILIVDDQEANVTLLAQMLKGAGYTAVMATRDPTQVCALHRANHYDLILLDLQMPGMDGFQVMEGLKEIEAGGYLPVLVITAQPAHQLRALKAGAKDFVSKPFDLAEVLMRVHNLLEVRLLHQSETIVNLARLENSQRIAGLGDWEYDYANHRLVWSEEVYRILGLARADAPPNSETFYRQVHPDDRASIHREKKAAAEGARRADFEYRIIRPGGEVRYIHQLSEMTFNEQVRPVRESGTMQDVTERKLADEALRQSEERYRKMLMLSPDAQFVNVEGIITFANEAFYRLMGATKPEQLIGRHWDEIVHPDDHALAAERRRKIMDHLAISTSELRFIRIDGTAVEVEIASVMFDFLGRKEVQVIARDITARKAAEVALRSSEERFKFVARAVSDVVWDWNLWANTLWWNDGFLTTFGFTAGEIEPSVEAWNNRIHPEDRARVVESIHQAIAAGQESWSAEYRFQRKDGTYAQVQDRGFILRDEVGQGFRMVGGMRDLTQQKEMEAQYLRAQRMESIGTLAGGIAHDLNNVLAPILMSIELLKLNPGTDPRHGKILDTIQTSCRRGAALVRQVLTFARGAEGPRVAIRLPHLITELKNILGETFPRHIRIVTDLPADLWPITGDPSQLHQVLLNLAVNARDAMPDGGTLTVRASNITLDAQYAATSQGSKGRTAQVAKAGPYVLLQVTDTGMGMSPEVRERIFDPFFTTKEIGQGTGIGLATVHTVVKSHAGFIHVESEVGRGATFKIYLPADPALRAAVTAPPFPIEIARGRDELVLVVDDEFSIRYITEQTLAAFGYRVITASDGVEAVALYARQAPQIAVVLTDMTMPLMEGAAFIQVLRRINPAVRIIAASGIDSGDNVGKATNAGVNHFLVKPYTAESLLQLVRQVIDGPAS